MVNKLEHFLAQWGVPVEELVRVRKARLMRQWWAAFAAPYKQPGQVWPAISKDCNWEVFSTGCAPAYEQEEAWRVFDSVPPSEFLLVPSDRYPMYRCAGQECDDLGAAFRRLETFLETEGRECLDTYIFDVDFHWTWVFTHESSLGLGPYFAISSAAPWLP